MKNDIHYPFSYTDTDNTYYKSVHIVRVYIVTFYACVRLQTGYGLVNGYTDHLYTHSEL
jgi:hypothetical protein